MWARNAYNCIVADEPLEEWPEPMEVHDAQPWDCSHPIHMLCMFLTELHHALG